VAADRKQQVPGAVLFHRLHEFVGDQARQVELAQPPVLALGLDEIHDVRVGDVEGAHLRPAPAAGGRDGEAHGIEDIHKREGTGGISPGPAHKELVTDAAASLQGQAGLVDRGQDAVHGVRDRPGHRAINGAGGGFVLQGAGVGNDAPGRDRPVLQGPEEPFEPFLAFFRDFLDVGQRPGHARIGPGDILVDDLAGLAFKAVFFIPDVE
jgi:hypothetical protein